MDDLAGRTTGQRIRHFRERAGMSRPILGGLVGKSAEWIKAVEGGRLMTPRLPLLLRIAEVLAIEDLAKLTGDERLSTATYTRAAHEQLPPVARVLASHPISAPQADPIEVSALEGRVTQMWELWHGTRRHRTAVGGLLPNLLRDARITVRRLDGAERRHALRLLAQTYHLTQLFLSFQPVPELVWLTGDRAMTAAQDADDPRAMAIAAWYMNHVFRAAGEQQEARVQLALDTAALLRPEADPDDRALWGLLHLAVALSCAKMGQDGSSWRYWDQANDAARSLGAGYVHPYMIFGQGMVDAYAITMHTDLMHGGEAVRVANRVDLGTMPSATRRSGHLIEMARAYSLRREHVATVHLLRKAYDESPDTARFNLFARSATLELAERGGATVRGDARELAARLQLTP